MCMGYTKILFQKCLQPICNAFLYINPDQINLKHIRAVANTLESIQSKSTFTVVQDSCASQFY